jgi:hypothetical protein
MPLSLQKEISITKISTEMGFMTIGVAILEDYKPSQKINSPGNSHWRIDPPFGTRENPMKREIRKPIADIGFKRCLARKTVLDFGMPPFPLDPEMGVSMSFW